MKDNSRDPQHLQRRLLRPHSEHMHGGEMMESNHKPDYLQSLIKYIPVTLLKYLTNKEDRIETSLPDC
jgi:hypothetical protein